MNLDPSAFTHLETHSHYTLLGSTISVDEMVARAAADGLTHLPLTDSNVLYGAIAFSKACRAADLQPIIGMAVTAAAEPDDDASPGHLVLLASGPKGYRSLCRLSSLMQGNPQRDLLAPRGLSWEELKSHREGLICLSGGRRGPVDRFLRAGDERSAYHHAARLAGIFEENAFLALELHRPQDKLIAHQIASIGGRLGIPCVAVQPVYTLAKADSSQLALLSAIDRNCRLAELPPSALPNGGDPKIGTHWLGPDEMVARFTDFPEALSNVAEVISRCKPALPDGSPIWPVLKLPANQTPADRLTHLARQGLATRYGPDVSPEIETRLQRELDTITRHGYAPLFLIVADAVHFARRDGVPVSTRGSVANSLVAYCTGITTVDPIEHDLLFERFLNPARANPPDIDLDFCSRRRDRVLEYVRRTYGEDQVALVATVSTMRPKSAVRETAKAFGLDEPAIKRLTALLPHSWHPDPRRRDRRTVDDVLAELDSPREQEIIRRAYEIVGQPHHLSVHPGAVVITPGPLTDVVPVQWAAKGFLITQFDHNDVEALGLPKIDMLGISALTVMADTIELVNQRRDSALEADAIPLDDPQTAQMLALGDTIGVFQCESEGARKTLRQLRASSVRDLAVANAFFKPGPATGGMARNFVRRYRGEEPVSYLHPALEPVLGPTKGVLLFQEQVLRVAREIAGLSWEQADHLRRGMSRFQTDEMARMRQAFVDGCQKTAGFLIEQAETLWEQVEAFSGYGFNQGHATAYADVSYRLAYLKAHYPAELLCARLRTWGGFHPPAVYIAEAVRLGFTVQPPHVNHSRTGFSLSDTPRPDTLWMGLGQVRDLRRNTVRAIIAARKERPFADLRDLLVRVDLQAKEATHLIQCGALDGLGRNRASLLGELNIAGGNALQLSFGFSEPEVKAETPGQRLAWEQAVLGQPISVHPLVPPANSLPEHVSLNELPQTAGRAVTAVGYRLPGWMRGQGFLLCDGRTFVTARGGKSLKTPSAWQPASLRGRWKADEFGTAWFEIESMRMLISPDKIK